ncbi:capsular polysaccharide transport system permease protein [Xaviernesmea oryzae]|uniref:Capsular polysaccharide transport system permease protein n=1 Tax=Xaviernesmea oryzae TaxID=464029 RepID=A0A1X7FSE3_9HYPH|nr:ABC transporter permease [Xaviernesmea oryzae]SMF57893.1 capsular polysaccharide transport system permease protein [Xaviernesmea oryzae]
MSYLTSHVQIVLAFIIREVASRYGRSPGGYLWAFLQPIAFIVLMSFIMGSLGRIPALGESFPLFYATGFLSFNFYKGMEGYLGSAVRANRPLMSYPTVAPIDAVMGRFILEGATSLVVAIVILGGAMLFLRHPLHLLWTPMIEAIALAWTLALGVALMNIVLFFRFPLYEKAFGIVMRPLFLLSGVFYVPGEMPHPAREFLLDNPITHLIMLFRWGFYGERAAQGLDIWFLGEFALAMLFIGMCFFTFWSVARERVD